MEFSGKLVGRIAHDCGISESEVAKRLVKIACQRAGAKPNPSPLMKAWGKEWTASHLATLTGINRRTLTHRWENGVRFPELIERPFARKVSGQEKATDREVFLEERALTRDAEACQRLLERLRKFHPELEMIEDDQGEETHTASGVINGARYRNAGFAGLRSTGHMEAI